MRQQKPYFVDDLMWNTLRSLQNDFRSELPLSFSSVTDSIIERRDLKSLRALELNMFSDMPVGSFKRVYQILSLFKRAILTDDSLRPDDLVNESIDKFTKSQERLSTLQDIPIHLQDVMMWIRGLTADILGEYDESELTSLCEYGRHAAVGVPLAKANLAAKWDVNTGSSSQLDWFAHSYMRYNRLLLEHQRSAGVQTQVVDELKLTFVPKSYKSCRAITPNTTIGSLRTDGLGKMIARRLKLRAGLDISTLQERHRDLAKEASATQVLVTCDQRSASDNITGWLLRQCLPSRWYAELDAGRIARIRLPNDKVINTFTFCTMGIGFTFPLQTLIFYCCAKAISYSYFDGTDFVSCYGDDLIVSSRLWPFVRRIFPYFGFEFNEDKTFASGFFRESCGGDYYRGVDVRPFQPKWVSSARVSRREYDTLIYRFINGLRRRWDDEEIEQTLCYLKNQLDDILYVPLDFSDDAGMRVDRQYCFHNDVHFLRNRNGAAIFTYLRHKSKEVEETRFLPYYAYALKHGQWEATLLSHKRLKNFVTIPGAGAIQKVRAVTMLL